jgi:hypothetical protein
VWRRERVGRTSMVVEVGGEDPEVLSEMVVGEDPAAVGGDPTVVSGQGGVEADVEEERAHGMDLAVVGEAWRWMRSAVREAWRWTQ